MLRHEFQPGKLVAGVFLIAAGVVYAGAAHGLWRIPWFAAVPLVVGGLCLAGVAALLNRAVRRNRAGRCRPGPGLADVGADRMD
ncbi:MULTISPECIES: hypothetical protein [Streptomyces]|uniref:hypothetical protein n=1 Tax=Streptomyces TaxID=1883 RepID=UPI0001D05C51|nr:MULTISPECIES: hypothetical protein [Streptomyces]EFF92670.1 conserved hypothetical protein [Streptomyces sp. e14]MBY8868041.1 hypothetical protein [Streptomyces sennicomposti]NED77867.1 hypothetical protein [Streptomyces sp. SID9944]